MRRSTALGVVAAAVAVCVGMFGADAAPERHAARQPVQPANSHPKASAASTPQDSAVETTFVALTPCRIVDTRLGGGALAGRATRTFQVTGSSGFTAQGGTGSGCGVPAAATAVSATVIATEETGPGYLTIYPNGATKPTATALSFATADTRSSNTNAVLGTSGQIRAFSGAPKGSTQIVLDVTGYFLPQMRAQVSSTGALVRGSRVTSAAHLRTGGYQVDFDRDVSTCAYAATSYFFGTTIQVQPRLDDTRGVYVASADDTGHATDASFYLTITC